MIHNNLEQEHIEQRCYIWNPDLITNPLLVIQFGVGRINSSASFFNIFAIFALFCYQILSFSEYFKMFPIALFFVRIFVQAVLASVVPALEVRNAKSVSFAARVVPVAMSDMMTSPRKALVSQPSRRKSSLKSHSLSVKGASNLAAGSAAISRRTPVPCVMACKQQPAALRILSLSAPVADLKRSEKQTLRRLGTRQVSWQDSLRVYPSPSAKPVPSPSARSTVPLPPPVAVTVVDQEQLDPNHLGADENCEQTVTAKIESVNVIVPGMSSLCVVCSRCYQRTNLDPCCSDGSRAFLP